MTVTKGKHKMKEMNDKMTANEALECLNEQRVLDKADRTVARLMKEASIVVAPRTPRQIKPYAFTPPRYIETQEGSIGAI